MKLFRILFISLIVCGSGFATDRYVSLTGTNDTAGGYADWAGSATQIQWAVNVAAAGETIWVSNGTYHLTNTITMNSAITARSVNGSTVTIINGNYPDYTNGCFNITKAVYLYGFTITNGYSTSVAGGVSLTAAATGATVTNCVIAGNKSDANGGGISMLCNATIVNCIVSNNSIPGSGGGLYASTTAGSILNSLFVTNTAGTGGGLCADKAPSSGIIISNCIFDSNAATNGHAGGVWINGGSVLNCTITKNSARTPTLWPVGPSAGGIYLMYGWMSDGVVLMKDCVVDHNTAMYIGGGIRSSSGANSTNIIENCIIVSNAVDVYGGGLGLDSNFEVRNCLIASNSGVGGGAWITAPIAGCAIHSCTIVNNRAPTQAGGLYGNGVESVINTIIYSNTAPTSNNIWGITNAYYCCSDPLIDGAGNISYAPSFANYSAGNYRLANNSPCINAGMNQDWMTNAVDLDTRPRLDRRNGRVDIGAYEFIHNSTIISVH